MSDKIVSMIQNMLPKNEQKGVQQVVNQMSKSLLEELTNHVDKTNYRVTARIEIPKGSNVKYEIDKETGDLVVDRMLYSPAQYFFNYGYIVNTLGGDGDPLDAVVLCDDKLYPMCRIQCKVIGMLETYDEKGRDEKIILVPDDHIDHSSIEVNDIKDVSKKTQHKLYDFFDTYKKRENGKKTIIGEFKNKDEAMKVISQSQNDYKLYASDARKKMIPKAKLDVVMDE
jgi:inorganic pyrophosphatase